MFVSASNWMPLVPNMKAWTGVQMLSKIVVAKLALVKDVFLTSVKVVITLIPPMLLGSKAIVFSRDGNRRSPQMRYLGRWP